MRAGEEEPPVVAGPVYGLRTWNLSAVQSDFRLGSAGAMYRWGIGEPEPAVCQKGLHPAPAPGHDCTCGYYCYHVSPRSLFRVLATAHASLGTVAVAGIVKVWGRIEVYETGMRTEFAKPDVLFLPRRATEPFDLMVTDLAEKYGAEVWAGEGKGTFDRIKTAKPGLAEDLTDFGNVIDPDLRARLRSERLKRRIRGRLRRKRLSRGGASGAGPAGPHGEPGG